MLKINQEVIDNFVAKINNKANVSHGHNSHISYGQVDSTSTSTAFTATVDGLTELTDGTTVMLRNGRVTSAAGFTLNVNNLGAKPVYNNMADATADTTIFNINYTMLFVYDSTRITGGCWICYRGYNSDNNTIGYQIRTNSTSFTPLDKTYRYRIMLEVENNKLMPVNTSSSTSATASKTSTMNTREFKLGGNIYYYSYSSAINANAYFGTGYIWRQYNFALGYSFNNTNAALVMTAKEPVYMIAKQTSNGMAKLKTPFFTQTLPNTADGLLYILLGYATSEVNLELTLDHPIYEYRDGGIKLYRDTYTKNETDTLLNGKASSSHTHTTSNITDFPSTMTPSSHSHGNVQNNGTLKVSNTLQTNKSVCTDTNGNIIAEDKNNHTHSQYLTSHQDISNKIDTAGTGLSKSGTTLNHSNSVTALATSSLKKITYDAQGHITQTNDVTASDLPAHSHGNITTDGILDSTTVTYNYPNDKIVIKASAYDGALKPVTQIPSGVLWDSNAHNNIGSSANDTQATINTKIDTALGNKQATLSSGTNIKKLSCNNNEYDLLSNPSTTLNFKTINGSSVIGTGDIAVSGGSGNVSLACISDLDLDDTDPTDVELFLDVCDGKLIDTITKSTSGLTDTYTITYTDSTTYQFTVTNGQDGSNATVTIDNALSSSSENPVQNKVINTALGNKLDKASTDTGFVKSNGTIVGFGTTASTVAQGNHTHSAYVNPTIVDNLSSDSSTSVLSAKQGKALNTNKIETSAIATSFSSTTSDSKIPSEKLVKTELDKKITKSSTATGLLKDNGAVDTNTYLTTSSASSTYVAKENGKGLFSGSYSDLTSKPSYTPTVTSSTTGSYEIGKINISGSDVTIYGKDTDTHQSLTNYLQKTDVKDNLTSTDTDKPLSAKQGKELKTLVDGKQAALVSGTSIKTINNESLLGSGNISISGGGNITVDSSLNTNSTNAIQNQAVARKFVKLGDIDGAYSYYGGLFELDDVYGVNDVKLFGRLVYSGDEDKLYYSKDDDLIRDEIATLGDIPSVPSASFTTPSADTTSGSYGSGTVYARANHTHPKSSLYAESGHNHSGTYANASHNHNISDLNNTTTVAVTVTYTDNSTETINLLKYTGS